MSRYLGIMATEQVEAYLQQLVGLGLWGDDVEEVMHTLVMRGLQDAMASGHIHYVPAGSEDPAVKCEHCHDGAKRVRDIKADGTCPKCGELLEIPF